MTIHMLKNDAALPSHVCRGIGIHAIDILQPPGIAIAPSPDIDPHQAIVTAAHKAKSSAEMHRKVRREVCSDTSQHAPL
jgi:hypothetical protein